MPELLPCEEVLSLWEECEMKIEFEIDESRLYEVIEYLICNGKEYFGCAAERIVAHLKKETEEYLSSMSSVRE